MTPQELSTHFQPLHNLLLKASTPSNRGNLEDALQTALTTLLSGYASHGPASTLGKMDEPHLRYYLLRIISRIGRGKNPTTFRPEKAFVVQPELLETLTLKHLIEAGPEVILIHKQLQEGRREAPKLEPEDYMTPFQRQVFALLLDGKDLQTIADETQHHISWIHRTRTAVRKAVKLYCSDTGDSYEMIYKRRKDPRSAPVSA